MLLADWAATQPPGAVGWVSLEPADRSRERLLRAIAVALGRPPQAVEQPVTLVLDDLQELGDAGALAELRALLRRLPPPLKVIVGTRREPPLGLRALRSAGRVAELGEAELAFTLDEARALLPDVRADVAERIWERTQGWAAGLRLAALGLEGHAEPARFATAFGPFDETVADYFVTEVLDAQPPELVAFLGQIAVADAVCGDLADALSGRDDGDRLLSRLGRDHVVAPVAGARGWWRLHPLLAELLRADAEPGERPALHRRAARWLGGHGFGPDALVHAAAGDDPALLAELAAAHWTTLLLDGRIGTLRPVVDRPPDELAAGGPALALTVAAVYLEAGAVALAASWLETADCAGEPAYAALDLLRGRLAGDVREPLARARALAVADAGGVHALILLQAGIAQLWMGDIDQAERDLRAACQGGTPWLRLVATAHRVVRAVLAGGYDDALRLAGEAEAIARDGGWLWSWPMGVVAGARSGMALHRQELDEATAQAERAMEAIEGSADPPLRAMTALQQAGVLTAHGRHEEALLAADAAGRWLGEWPISPAMRELLVGFQTTLRAAVGEDVEPGAPRADRSLEGAIAVAKLALQDSDAADAIAVLEPHLSATGASVDFSRAEAWVLMALAHDARGDAVASSEALEQALRAAAPGTLRRPFLEHGDAVVPLLERQLRLGTRYRELAGDLLAG